ALPISDRLREAILKGDFAEGDALPTERELAAQTGLGRGSVREALRTLSVEGLLETRLGRHGGNIVTLPGDGSMANAVNQFVRGRRIPLRALQETREALEPTLARLAALRRTEADLARLRVLHAALANSADDFRKFSSVNLDWHNAVAKASANELLASFFYAISHGVGISTTTEDYDTPATREQVIAVHGEINDAIERRNAELAERRMRQHIMATHSRGTALETTCIPLSDDGSPGDRME
ncbi:MAG: FCD domain-containing protein, partial [Amphiplicatus sp.]